MKFTIATATYNRADVLYRVYDSLNAQTFKDFEWIIIDDGSTDNTADIVKTWKDNSDYPIAYYYQENSGKHMAINKAVEYAKGEFFIIADSDDSFVPEALQVLLQYWEDITIEERAKFRGVTCRCYDALTNAPIGCEFPNGICDILGAEGTFKRHYSFEMWGFNRTDVMKQFPFPNTEGEGLHFYPESVIWNRMGLKYKVRYVNDALRAYYRDQENATTVKKGNRSKENIHLWEHYVNDVFKYFWNCPKLFIKATIGLSMDGFLLHKSFREVMSIPKHFRGKILTFIFSPIGYVLYLKRR